MSRHTLLAIAIVHILRYVNGAARQHTFGRSGMRHNLPQASADKMFAQTQMRRNVKVSYIHAAQIHSSTEQSSNTLLTTIKHFRMIGTRDRAEREREKGKAARKLESDCSKGSSNLEEEPQLNFSDPNDNDSMDANSGDIDSDSNDGQDLQKNGVRNDGEFSPSNEENSTMTILGNNDDFFDDDGVAGFVLLDLDEESGGPIPLDSTQNTTEGEQGEISHDSISNDVRG